MKRISPPTGVQARPVTTPSRGCLRARSLLWMGRPRTSFTSEGDNCGEAFCPLSAITTR